MTYSEPTHWTYYLFPFAAFAIYYVSCFLHEVGHVVLACCTGYDVTAFGMGLGRPFLVFTVGRTRVYFARPKIFQGLTWLIYPNLFRSRWAAIALHSGGVLANLLVALTAGLLAWLHPAGQNWWLGICLLNAFFTIINLVPISSVVNGKKLNSDGAQILQMLRNDYPEYDPVHQLQAVRGLSFFWEAIDDRRSHHLSLLAASIRIKEWNLEQADAFLAKARSLIPSGEPFELGLQDLTAAMLACAAGKLPECEQFLDQADASYRAGNLTSWLFLVDLTRAELALRRKQFAQGLVILERLRDSVTVKENLGARRSLLLNLVCARAASPDGAGLMEARAELAALKPFKMGDQIYLQKSLADFYVRRQDWDQAERAYRLAVDETSKFFKSLTDAVDRERFQKASRPLLDGAADCFRKLDKNDEADKLADFFTPAPSVEPVKNMRWTGVQLWAGLLLAAFNFAIGLNLFEGARIDGPIPDHSKILDLLAGILLMAFAAVALLLASISILIRWLKPKGSAGEWMPFAFAIVPELILLAVFIMDKFKR